MIALQISHVPVIDILQKYYIKIDRKSAFYNDPSQIERAMKKSYPILSKISLFLFTTIFLFNGRAVFADETSKKNIIVDVETSRDISETARRSLRTAVETAIQDTGRFQIIDNDRIADLLKELALAQSGLTEEREIKLLKTADAFIYVHIKVEIGDDPMVELTYVDHDRKKYTGTGRFLRDEYGDASEDAMEMIIAQIDGRAVTSRGRFSWKHGGSALLRSALLPGWGQIYNGSDRKGYAIMGGAVFFGLYAFMNKNQYNTAQNDYNSASMMGFLGSPGSSSFTAMALFSKIRADGAKSRMDGAAQNFNIASLILAGLYVYNIFDAGYSAASALPPAPAQQTTLHQASLAMTGEAYLIERKTWLSYSWSF